MKPRRTRSKSCGSNCRSVGGEFFARVIAVAGFGDMKLWRIYAPSGGKPDPRAIGKYLW